MSRQSGNILIVVSGALALMFSIGVVILLVSAHSSTVADNGIWGSQARFSADSALEISLGAMCYVAQEYKSLSHSKVAITTEKNFDFLDNLLPQYLSIPDVTLPLKWEDRRSVFDLYPSKGILLFPGISTCSFTEAQTNVESRAIDSNSLTFPSDEEIESGEIVQCTGQGTWNLKIYGWGRVFQTKPHKIPLSSIVASESIQMTFKVAIKKTSPDETFEAYVFFSKSPKIQKREMISFSEVSHLQWQGISTNPD